MQCSRLVGTLRYSAMQCSRWSAVVGTSSCGWALLAGWLAGKTPRVRQATCVGHWQGVNSPYVPHTGSCKYSMLTSVRTCTFSCPVTLDAPRQAQNEGRKRNKWNEGRSRGRACCLLLFPIQGFLGTYCIQVRRDHLIRRSFQVLTIHVLRLLRFPIFRPASSCLACTSSSLLLDFSIAEPVWFPLNSGNTRGVGGIGTDSA